jgi:transposase
MPRSSLSAIILSLGEEADLRWPAANYTLPGSQVQRAKMILHAALGMPNDEIAAGLDTRREVVSLWRKRFFADRLVGLEERDRPGRPRTFSPELVVQVKA